MAHSGEAVIIIGYDDRETVASDVAAYSIKSRTKTPHKIKFLKHRELRKNGLFYRPWGIDADTGDYRDLIDAKPFTTQFSHSRFLVPEIQGFKGWALFMDADMIFTSDIKDLFALCDDKYAVMVVKHHHHPTQNSIKMDGRLQQQYYRKNWSSFVLWNCSHHANKILTKERVNFMKGGDLHAFSWLSDEDIGSIPYRYNYISGVSPKLPEGQKPAHIHYTEGGPWFEHCKDVPYADLWMDEFLSWQTNADHGVIQMPATSYEISEKTKK